VTVLAHWREPQIGAAPVLPSQSTRSACTCAWAANLIVNRGVADTPRHDISDT
jgi:hypothetical protein